MLFPLAQIRHCSMDLADHPGLGPLLMTVRVQGTTTAVIFATVAVRKNVMWNDSFLATLLATVEGTVHGDPLLPDNWNFHGSHLRNTRCDSLHGGHQMRFASRRSPSPKRMGFVSDAGPSSSRRPLSRDSRSPRPRSSKATLLQGFPLSKERFPFSQKTSL